MGARTTTTKIWLALLTVYFVWGSTYLAIRYAIGADTGETGLPPLLMAGVRHLLAGIPLFLWSVRRPAADGAPDRLGRREWRSTAIIGILLLLGGNGGVVLAEQRVSSGLAAVIVAAVPIWVTLIGLARHDERLSRLGTVGLVVGFVGVAVLANPFGAGRIDPIGVLLLFIATLAWSGGSYYSRTAAVPRRPLVMTSMEMLGGGAALMVLSLVTGDAFRLDIGAVGPKAWAALAYLTVFGSLLAFTAYVWVVRAAPLSLVTTYAYVNPIVALALGALMLNEKITVRAGLATALIVAGVALLVTVGRRPAPPVGAPALTTVEPPDLVPVEA